LLLELISTGKVLGARFHELFPAQAVKGFGLHGAGATGFGVVLAVHLHLFQDALPSSS
jgi:hypothetical protein